MDFYETIFCSTLGFMFLFYFSYYSLLVHQSRKRDNIQKQGIFPVVSLVIPTYNEEKVVLRKLENVKNQDYPKRKLEVVVIDSASTDNTCNIVQEFMKQNSEELKLRLISQSQRLGKASALNYAWKNCSGEIIVISDADATLDESAIKKIVENFADPAVGAATGRLVMLNPSKSVATRLDKSYRSIFVVLRKGESNMDSTPIFSGPIAAFRRELLDDLKLTTIADDTELCLKIREKGFKAIYDPEAIAYEFYPTKTKSRMKQKIRRGQGIIQSFMWHRRILFNSKYGKYGLVIFPCEFFMHIISPILFSLIIISATIIVFNNPAILTRFGLVAILLLVLFGLILLAQSTLRIRKTMINPITVVATFLDHQIFLLLSLFSLLLRRNVYKWEKIEEVRTFCTVNN